MLKSQKSIRFSQGLPASIRALAKALFKGEVRALTPTTQAGWSSTAVNGGSVVQQDPMRIVLRATSAIGPASSIVASVNVQGMNSDGARYDYIDWDKDLLVACNLALVTGSATNVAFFQLKTAATIGELGALGMEFRVANLALKGNAYGTSLGTEVDLGQSFTSSQPALLSMFLNAAGVEWFFNNVSKGTLTAANKFPTGMGAATGYIVFSNDNGGTATQTDVYAGGIWIVQEV